MAFVLIIYFHITSERGKKKIMENGKKRVEKKIIIKIGV